MNYHINADGYQVTLLKEKCLGIWNDELYPVDGLDFDAISAYMVHMPTDAFALEYFEDDCEICPPKPRGKKKLVPYLEGHFYVFAKEKKIVTTSISPDFIPGSFETLEAKGDVDLSYILSIIVCPNCGHYQFSLEQVDM